MPSGVPSVDARAPRARRRARRGSSRVRRGVTKNATKRRRRLVSSPCDSSRPSPRVTPARSASRLGPLRPPFFLFFSFFSFFSLFSFFSSPPRALASSYSNVTGGGSGGFGTDPHPRSGYAARSTSTVRAVASLRLSTCKMALLDLEFSRISRSLGRCASSISSAQSDGFDAADDASGLFSESHRASGASARAASNWR